MFSTKPEQEALVEALFVALQKNPSGAPHLLAAILTQPPFDQVLDDPRKLEFVLSLSRDMRKQYSDSDQKVSVPAVAPTPVAKTAPAPSTSTNNPILAILTKKTA